MKYYICIEEPPKAVNEKCEDENLFIQEVFNSYKINNYYGDNRFYYFTPKKQNILELRKGQIYHTTSYSDDYVIDDYGMTHKLIGLRQYLKEYNFELDDETKKLIKTKEKRGDTIVIEPFSYSFKLEKVIYNIAVHLGSAYKSKMTMDYSPFEGIIYCYKCLRRDNQTMSLIKKCMEGKAYSKNKHS